MRKKVSNAAKCRFTLVELLVSMGVLLIILGFILQFFVGSQRLWQSMEQRNSLYADARVAMDVMTTMRFTGRGFDRGGRVGQKVMSTAIAATLFVLVLKAGALLRAVVMSAAEGTTSFLFFQMFQVYLQSADVHAGQFYGHSLSEAERFAAVLAAQFLPFLIKYVVVAAERFHPHHAFHGHAVEFHEKAEIHDAADDAFEAFTRAAFKQQTAHAPVDFPFGVGGRSFPGVALFGRFQEFVPRRNGAARVEAENIA